MQINLKPGDALLQIAADGTVVMLGAAESDDGKASDGQAYAVVIERSNTHERAGFLTAVASRLMSEVNRTVKPEPPKARPSLPSSVIVFPSKGGKS